MLFLMPEFLSFERRRIDVGILQSYMDQKVKGGSEMCFKWLSKNTNSYFGN